jgi:glutamyl-tRNA reductase
VTLLAIGMNHRSAPLSVRERAALRPEELAPTLAHLNLHAEEAMILSTCNRSEVYLSGLRGDALAAFEGAWGHSLRPYLYVYQGEMALRHLMRVTSGLDSLVLGETQIQGQVRRAWDAARSLGATGPRLNRAVQLSIETGKAVRSRTGISDKAVSVSYAAVRLAQTILGELQGKTAVLIGAGETAELTLTHLRASGIAEALVLNRNQERARDLAARWGAAACPVDRLREILPRADLVIASAAAPHYVLRRTWVEQVMAGRSAPLFLIDISVPRILDPACAEVEGVYLYNLDDLRQLVADHLADRARYLPEAEALIEQALERYRAWLLGHRLGPQIAAAQEVARQLAAQEAPQLLAAAPLPSRRAQAAAHRLSARMLSWMVRQMLAGGQADLAAAELARLE